MDEILASLSADERAGFERFILAISDSLATEFAQTQLDALRALKSQLGARGMIIGEVARAAVFLVCAEMLAARVRGQLRGGDALDWAVGQVRGRLVGLDVSSGPPMVVPAAQGRPS